MRTLTALALLAITACGDTKLVQPIDTGDSERENSSDVNYEGDEPGECSDGADNDQDGLFDCDDDGCAGSADCADGTTTSTGTTTTSTGTTPTTGTGTTTTGTQDGEDSDDDGFIDEEDCDDDNPLVTTRGTGASENCPAQSCKEILENGYSVGDGSYWLEPYGDGSELFLGYCDMSLDGGGWTYVARGSNTETQTNDAYNLPQADPLAITQWHLSAESIYAMAGPSLYQSYIVMGEGGDSDTREGGQYRIRTEHEAMTFEAPMYNYDAWNGSEWVPATGTADSTHRGPSWVMDESNVCCETDDDNWASCYRASEGLGLGLWSQGNANQHLRCKADSLVQNGLLLFVR